MFATRGWEHLTDSVFPAPLWPVSMQLDGNCAGSVPLSRHDDRLAGAVFAHGGVRVLGNGE